MYLFLFRSFCIWLKLPAEFSWPASNKGKVLSHCAPLVAHKARSSCANLRSRMPSRTFDHSYAVRAPDFCLFPSIWSLWTAKFYSSAPSSFRIHGAHEEMRPGARLRDISISFLAPGMDTFVNSDHQQQQWPSISVIKLTTIAYFPFYRLRNLKARSTDFAPSLRTRNRKMRIFR